MWLVQDDLDYREYDRLYRHEALEIQGGRTDKNDKKDKCPKPVRRDGRGLECRSVKGDIIDLTLSDGDDEMGKTTFQSNGSLPGARLSAGDGPRAGGPTELRATFASPTA